MKLSEGIILGDSLRTRNPEVYTANNLDGSWCGCAIGGAQLAAGEFMPLAYLNLWPWLNKCNKGGYTYDEIISRYFTAVCEGTATIEQLADYVRSIEPDCGECNKFDCTCVKELTSKAKPSPTVGLINTR